MKMKSAAGRPAELNHGCSSQNIKNARESREETSLRALASGDKQHEFIIKYLNLKELQTTKLQQQQSSIRSDLSLIRLLLTFFLSFAAKVLILRASLQFYAFKCNLKVVTFAQLHDKLLNNKRQH